MGQVSSIQWTDATWNVARGCSKVDEDCKFCYMYRDSFDGTRYNPREVVRTKTVFTMPLKYKETKSNCWPGNPLIFTSSLTDFFHEDIDSYRDEAWDIIRKCPHFIFQILTKRPKRIIDHLPEYWDEIKGRVWLGTSVGAEKGMQRIWDLIEMKGQCAVLFLSAEPLHEPIDLNEYYFPYRLIKNVSRENRTKLINLLDWVIVGGESGHETGQYRYRPCKEEWIGQIVQDCGDAGVPVFVKQMGTYLSKKLGMSDRHGGNIEEFPKHLQLRQFPNYDQT